jgi:hypothetical protein
MTRFQTTPAANPGPTSRERRNTYRQAASAAGVLHLGADTEIASPGEAAIGAAINDESSIPVHIFNLSMYDVGFSAVTRLAIGQVCRLELPDGRRGSTVVQICSVRPRPDGLYDIGGRFC